MGKEGGAGRSRREEERSTRGERKEERIIPECLDYMGKGLWGQGSLGSGLESSGLEAGYVR